MITITKEYYMELCEEHGGFCLDCSEEAYGVEPDARECTCEYCGRPRVFGIEELLLRGDITFEEV